jgi:hypothetical protein
MKKSIIIPFLFVSLFTYSQSSNVAYDLLNGNPVTQDPTTNLKLPINFSFTNKFIGKNVKFLNEDGIQVIALNNSKFGSGDLSKDGETNTFHIVINEDRTVNPGDEKINSNKFVLQIDQAKITISLISNSPANNPINISNATKQTNYVAGYVYYDAIKLVELLNNKSDDKTIVAMLKAYNVDVSNINKNPYLNEIFGNFLAQRPEGGAASSFLTNLGNTDITYFAAGLSRFLAERTKEELNEAFFCRMNEQLNAYPELKTLFPKTASFLNIIETYSYASVIQVLKESFETDIQNLPENLYNLKDLTFADCDKEAICGSSNKDCNNFKDCQARLKKLTEFFNTEEGHWIGLGMFLIKEGIQSSNPADLLKSIVGSSEFAGIKEFSMTNKKYNDCNVESSIELSNFFSQSLISKDNKQIWVNSVELSALFSTKDAFKVYLGLLLSYELREKDKVVITFYKPENKTITFGNILLQAHDSLSKYEPQITSLIRNTHTVFNSVNNAVKKMISAVDKSAEADPQALYDYYKAFTASLKPITNSPLLKAITGNDFGVEYDKVAQFLNPAADMTYHISTKKYSAAIYDASILLNSLNNVFDENKHPVFQPVTKSFIKYGILISTVANAQSSDEVKQALEASVLPVGSYSIKRKTSWSFSINSYVGAYWSYTNSKDNLPHLGLSAPIGFNISKGFSKNGKYGGLSLNLQIIDVGALVNYYLIKGDTASLPNEFKVKLSNIFAPGFNLCYNVPKTPLSFAWGGQYIPTLYNYEQVSGKNELTPKNAWRWQLSILIDIPMYNVKVWDFNK